MIETHILYVDHQGHPAPITECYHATASRRLSASVARFPPSTVTEVDSAYCPQCLSFHDAASAARLGYCSKATCRRCPLCCSVASVAVGQDVCFYKCGLCDWTSQECNLSVVLPPGAGKTEVVRAAEELGEELNRRQKVKADELQNYFQELKDLWEERTKEEHLGGNLKISKREALAEGWSVEALESTISEKHAKKSHGMIKNDNVVQVTVDDAGNQMDQSLSLMKISSWQLQALCVPSRPISKTDVLPLPIPLRARKSRRCRAELAEGRPGILLKPKLNPLEGDSSLRTGHGQWWKKDSSAVHVVPRIKLVKHVKIGDGHVILIKVSNPTLGLVRLCFTGSQYSGEPQWDDAGAKKNDLEHLLVDTLNQSYVNCHLLPSHTKDMPSTETVELLSAEDTIMELGGKAEKVPDAVSSWNPLAEPFETSMRLVANHLADAWFELNVPNPASTVGPDWWLSVPISMTIEVGLNSWQSSLVQPEPSQSNESDYVSFDILVVWK